jgi:hypothetical protein
VNLGCVEKIAEAVLYEGYMLYPYRASAVKNRQRWNFGVLCPRAYCEHQDGSDAWMMQTECLLQSGANARLEVEVRFLQIINRSVAKLADPLREFPSDKEPEFEMVDQLTVGGRTFVPWQEAIERTVTVAPPCARGDSPNLPWPFRFPSGRGIEPLPDGDHMIIGALIRECAELEGSIEIGFTECHEGLTKVTVRVRNLTKYEGAQSSDRADALMHSLVSTHTILGAEGGQFVSLLDPPREFSDAVSECSNLGTWPVLVGEDQAQDTMLSSPIILYDYPQIAPESPGSLFDGTEIDEILSLRILTMTDEEKLEMRQSDERSREILERTENMPPEQFMKLHGVMRGQRPMPKVAQ